MSRQSSNESDQLFSGETEVRAWVNRILSALTVIVFGYVGHQLSELRATITHAATKIEVMWSDMRKLESQVNDHEQRLRDLERGEKR
jgi:hypothetical protein